MKYLLIVLSTPIITEAKVTNKNRYSQFPILKPSNSVKLNCMKLIKGIRTVNMKVKEVNIIFSTLFLLKDKWTSIISYTFKILINLDLNILFSFELNYKNN
jgi:hypothetical protein